MSNPRETKMAQNVQITNNLKEGICVKYPDTHRGSTEGSFDKSFL